ncbi:MAG: hypothetical protein H0T60_06440 [Acidobacteria bacterium]|nr:hypothetical protein [Acidobacteriota bacterium]
MQSNKTASVQVIPSAREDQRVEVVLEQRGGEDLVALRYSTWTEGLGWCCQKTLRLDGEQLDDLHRALTVARQRINRRRVDEGQTVRTTRVVRLPTLA